MSVSDQTVTPSPASKLHPQTSNKLFKEKVFGFPALGTKLSLNRNVQTSSNIMPPFFIHLHPIKFSKKSRGCCGYPHLASALNRPKLCRSVQRGGSHLESVETEA